MRGVSSKEKGKALGLLGMGRISGDSAIKLQGRTSNNLYKIIIKILKTFFGGFPPSFFFFFNGKALSRLPKEWSQSQRLKFFLFFFCHFFAVCSSCWLRKRNFNLSQIKVWAFPSLSDSAQSLEFIFLPKQRFLDLYFALPLVY